VIYFVRIKFVKYIEMPNPIENSSLWFKYANVDNDPELSKLEVINGLKATLPLDYTHLESEVNNCWSIWDINNSNSISLEEFTRPNTGLLAYILRHFQNHEPFSCLYCDQPISNKGGGVGVLCNEDGTRSCIHYFHSDCIKTQINNKNFSCLACNHPYKFSKLVPNPRTDPAGWFTIVDVNNDGKLNKTEVLEAIKSTLPVNWRRFEAQIFNDTDAESNLWKKWDHDNNGFICKSEFIIPKKGLLDYLLDNFSIPDPNPIPKLTPGRRETYRTYFRSVE
jgi:Ca2+-binding EF-hand superfamily protein